MLFVSCVLVLFVVLCSRRVSYLVRVVGSFVCCEYCSCLCCVLELV